MATPATAPAPASPRIDVVKIDGSFDTASEVDDAQLIFGWANVAVRKNGDTVVDSQDEFTTPDELEAAAYQFVLKFREANDTHTAEVKGSLVESVVFTAEKQAALGLVAKGDETVLPQGWWVGFHIPDRADYLAAKGGKRMFSIEGTAKRQTVEVPA